MHARLLVGVALVLVPLAVSGKRRRRNPPPVAVVAPARRIAVRVVLRGQVTELNLDEQRLRLRSSAAQREVTRRLDPSRRARLEAAVRAVLTTPDTRRSCGPGETFVTVTLDGTTNFTALCPEMPPAWVAPWQVLLDAVRELAIAGAGG